MGSQAQSAFQRPDLSFASNGTCAFNTIYDVLEWTAARNPHHLFARQLSPSLRSDENIDVSHAQLLSAVDRCAAWLVYAGIARPSRVRNGQVERGQTVGIFLGSDLSIYLYLLALSKLGNPFVLLSARLSQEALSHLVNLTHTRFILTDQRTWAACGDLAEVLPVPPSPCNDDVSCPCHPASAYIPLASPPLATWLSSQALPQTNTAIEKGQECDPDDRRVAILHSTGSTGLPKPIFQCHRWLIAHAKNHELPRQLNVEADINLNTLPLYHGFGLLAPSLSLSIGMTCALPSTSTVPTGTSTVKMIQASQAVRIFIVPSVLEELRCEPATDGRPSGMEALAKMKLIVVGGAPMRQETGNALAAARLPLLNHFGVTEIGALAPILHPPPSLAYDWRYLLIRQDLDIKFRGGSTCSEHHDDKSSPLQLGARPYGWTEDFWLQDALEPNPTASGDRLQVRIKGRIDDIIVLATGEKVDPAAFESVLREQKGVGEVVMFGSGRFQAGLLIEADKESRLHQDQLRDQLWPIIQQLNERADGHAQVERELVLLTDPLSKPLAKTLKGNPQRKANEERFAVELDAAYQQLDSSCKEAVVLQADTAALSRQLRDMVRTCLEAPARRAPSSLHEIPRRSLLTSDETDFFEAGMDSLKALRLRRLLDASLQAARPEQERLPALFVYHHPTVENLTRAIQRRLKGDCPTSSSSQGADLEAHIDNELEQSVTASLTRLLSWWRQSSQKLADQPHATFLPAGHFSQPGDCLVLTGSTGKLGGQLLREALTLQRQGRPRFEHIYCLVRGDWDEALQASVDHREQVFEKARARQLRIMADLGAPLSAKDAARLSVWPARLGDEHLGLEDRLYAELIRRTSHILHNAWPVDFMRPLASFEPHIVGMARLLLLSAEATQVRRASIDSQVDVAPPTRLLFTSSVAVAAQWPGPQCTESLQPGQERAVEIPEEAMTRASYAARLGYAQAKLACEQLAQRFTDVAKCETSAGPIFLALLVRVGQLTGVEGKGNWTTSEHVAMLAKSSLAVGALPDLSTEGPGTHSWIPVDRAAKACLELLCAHIEDKGRGTHYLHLENPARQRWAITLGVMGGALGLFDSAGDCAKVMPLPEWLQRVRSLGPDDAKNPAHKILHFLETDFSQLGTGRVVLNMDTALRWSAVLAQSQPIEAEEIERYVHFWRGQGFLDNVGPIDRAKGMKQEGD